MLVSSKSILIHSAGGSGHHLSYLETFQAILNAETSIGTIFPKHFLSLLRADRLLISTLDVDIAGFVAIACLRSLLHKPTAAIFLRPLQCFGSTRPLLHLFKRSLFALVKKLPELSILSLIPYYVNPDLCNVSHNWIYDPQLWDLSFRGPCVFPSTDLSQRALRQHCGKDILIYIGQANRIKGFDRLYELLVSNPSRYGLVMAGIVHAEYKNAAAHLRKLGALVEDRYVTDDEILSLYGIARFAWCCYAPEYDQSSGVFGRAYQAGVVPLVREGSVIDKIFSTLDGVSPPELYHRDIVIIKQAIRLV